MEAQRTSRFGDLASGGSGLGSALAAALTAGAGACAGGVCAVGVQAGASMFSAASSSSFAAMAAATGAAETQGSLATATTPLPWWLKLAVAALILSTAYTTATLREHRLLAILAALGGGFAVVAELRWLPVGQGGELLAIAVGVLPLVLGPLLLQLRLRRGLGALAALAAVLALGALGWVFWLQMVDGWQPCPLCWLQRIALVVIALPATIFWLRRRKRDLWVSSLGGSLLGLFAVFLQLGEMQASLEDKTGFCSLLSHTSCAAAGSQIFGPLPIALDAGVLFLVLFGLSIVAFSVQEDSRV